MTGAPGRGAGSLLGYEWLHAGWEKLQSPAWMAGGKALQGFVKGAIAASNEPEHPQVAYGCGSTSWGG